jgi:hypothetical protein
VAIISQTFRASTANIDLSQLFAQLTDESRRLKSKHDTDIEIAITTRDYRPKTKAKNDSKCNFCHKKNHTEAKYWKKHPNLKLKKLNTSNLDPTRDKNLENLGETELSLTIVEIIASTID